MLNSGKKICTLRDKKNKYSNSRVARKKNSNETKLPEKKILTKQKTITPPSS
jgi:hypothetical protein